MTCKNWPPSCGAQETSSAKPRPSSNHCIGFAASTPAAQWRDGRRRVHEAGRIMDLFGGFLKMVDPQNHGFQYYGLWMIWGSPILGKLYFLLMYPVVLSREYWTSSSVMTWVMFQEMTQVVSGFQMMQNACGNFCAHCSPEDAIFKPVIAMDLREWNRTYDLWDLWVHEQLVMICVFQHVLSHVEATARMPNNDLQLAMIWTMEPYGLRQVKCSVVQRIWFTWFK